MLFFFIFVGVFTLCLARCSKYCLLGFFLAIEQVEWKNCDFAFYFSAYFFVYFRNRLYPLVSVEQIVDMFAYFCVRICRFAVNKLDMLRHPLPRSIKTKAKGKWKRKREWNIVCPHTTSYIGENLSHSDEFIERTTQKWEEKIYRTQNFWAAKLWILYFYCFTRILNKTRQNRKERENNEAISCNKQISFTTTDKCVILI